MRIVAIILLYLLFFKLGYSQTETEYNLTDKSITYTLKENDLVWIGTQKGIYLGDTNGNINNNQLLIDAIKDVYITSIVIDSFNNKWFGTRNHGLLLYDNKKWSIFNSDSTVPNSFINSMQIDSHNNIWIATSQGVTKYNHDKWITYTSNDGLIHNAVTSLALDNKDNIWAATTFGISVLRDNKWVSYSDNSPGSNMVIKSMCIDHNDRKWLVTYSGQLLLFDNKVWHNLTNDVKEPYFGEKISFVCIVDDCIWTCSHNNFIKIRKNDLFVDFAFTFKINSINFDKNERPWINTEKNGVLSIDSLDYDYLFQLRGQNMNQPIPLVFDKLGYSFRPVRDESGHYIFSKFIFRSNFFNK